MDERARQRLQDILDVADELAETLEGTTKASFARNKGLQRIAERLLEIAGEAATHVPDAVAKTIVADWTGLRGLRVILAHAYHRVDVATLWTAAVDHLPRLAQAVRKALD